MSEQRPSSLTPHQPNQLQQQTIALTTPMMPTQAFYVPSDNNASLQHTAAVPPTGYIIAVPTVQNPTVVETYLSRQSVGLGIVLTILGVLTIIFNGVGFAVGDSIAVIGHGFWSGVLFIVTGVLGISAAKKTRCLIVTFMVFSIISAIATGALMGLGIFGAILNVYSDCDSDYGYSSCNMEAAVAMEVLLATLAVFAAVVSIWGSVICCRAICCCAPAYNSVVAAAYQQISFVSQQQQQPAGAVQYGISQMTPMTFAVPSPAYPLQSAYPRPQPPQNWTGGPLTQLGQQQQYYALNPQQPYGFAFVASSNVAARMPETVVGQPSPVNDPPAYDSSNDTKATSS